MRLLALLALAMVASASRLPAQDDAPHLLLPGMFLVEKDDRACTEPVALRVRLYDDATTATLAARQPAIVQMPALSKDQPPVTGSVAVRDRDTVRAMPTCEFAASLEDSVMMSLALPEGTLDGNSVWFAIELRDPNGAWHPLAPRIESSREKVGDCAFCFLPVGSSASGDGYTVEVADFGGFGAHRAPRPFDSAQWIANDRRDIRMAMLGDAMEKHLRLGMGESDVDALLGPPSETTLWKDWSRAYEVGCMIDCTWLVMRFAEGKLVAMDVVWD